MNDAQSASSKSNRPSMPTQARQELERLLTAVAAAGFYGSVSLTLAVQDGHIQHLRVATDRMMK